MAETKTYLVAGVTGNQGGAVARTLARRGHRIKGLTRDPGKARNLEAQGIEPVKGDLTDRSSLQEALRGADGFFIMTTPFKPDFSLDLEGEVRQGVTALDAAKTEGVEHVVLTSVGSADQETGIPHFETKARVEAHLKDMGLSATVVRPVWFMENFAARWLLPGIQAGTLAMPLDPDRKLQMVAVKDIGEIVARVFERPKEFAGQVWELAGDSRNLPDVAALIGERLGKPVRYMRVPDEQAQQAMGDDMMRMFQWFNRQGYGVDIEALEKRFKYPMTRFDEFVRTVKWAL